MTPEGGPGRFEAWRPPEEKAEVYAPEDQMRVAQELMVDTAASAATGVSAS
jgi:hypothetical protein